MKRLFRKRRGFSLIELLVVLVILALLVGLVAPRFIAQMGSGKVGAAKTQIGNIKNAIELYRLNMGSVPNSLEDLIKAPSGNSDQWKGPYLQDTMVVPKDPWGNEYLFEVPGPEGADYIITSLGEDGQPGGTGNAADLTNINTGENK